MKTPLRWLILLLLTGSPHTISAQIVGGSTPLVLHTANPKVDPDKTPDDVYGMDFSKLFRASPGMDVTEVRSGGIVADNFGTNGMVTLSAYKYNKDAADGKGDLIYRCYSDRNSTSLSDFVAKSDSRNVAMELVGSQTIETTDIVKLLASSNIYRQTCTRQDEHLTTGAKVAIASVALCYSGCAAATIFGWWTFGLATAGCLIGCSAYSGTLINAGVLTATEVTSEDYDCSAKYSPLQPILVEVSIQNATLRKVKLPTLGVADAAVIFKNPSQFRLTVSVNGTAQPTVSYPSATIPTYNVQMGDSVSFAIQSDADVKPVIEGVPGVWLARFAGEAFYYCSPSVTPGEYKPFLGFDSQVHGTAIRKYPAEWLQTDGTPDPAKIRETPFTRQLASGIYTNTWSWTACRQMDATKTAYTPAWTWNKMKSTPVVQRNNQREGLNMELLSANGGWLASYYSTFADIGTTRSKNYIYGFDPDEILYLDAKKPDTQNNAPGFGLFTIDSEPWKQNLEGDKIPLNLMVTAYRKNRSYVLDHRTLSKEYDGYEIQDAGTDATNPNGTGTGNVTAPGLVTVRIPGNKAIQVKFNVAPPFASSSYKGFYSHIEGTQWPAINETQVPYVLKLPTGLPTSEIAKYYLQYDFEDYLGILRSVIKAPTSTEQTQIQTSGKFTARFDMGGWGYHTVTAYYKRCATCTPVMIAGKELLDVGSRFLNLSTASYADNKDGAYIYLEEYRDAQQDAGSYTQRYSRYLDKYNREYTFTPGEQVNVKIYDSDPHTFALDETEWYLSERTQAKRIPDDSLNIYLKTYRSDLNASAPGTPVLVGSGKSFSFTAPSSTGRYELRATYRNTSDVYHLMGVANFSSNGAGNIKTGIDYNYLPTSTYINRIWALMTGQTTTNSNLQILAPRFTSSDYMFGTGPRANAAPHINRFGRFNDFANRFEWEAYHPATNSQLSNFGNVTDVTTFLNSYLTSTGTNAISAWYPSYWLRHYSDKNGTFPRDMKTTAAGTLSYLQTRTDTETKLGLLFTSLNPVEPWQLRLPWVSWTDYEGPRVRTNIKVVTSVVNFFDDTHGAFTGAPSVPSDPATFASQAQLNLMNDDQKDLKEAFYDFKYGRKLLIDKSVLTSQMALGEKQLLIKVYNRAQSDTATRILVYSGYWFASSQNGRLAADEDTQGMTIFPNPAKERVTVQFDRPVQNVDFQVFDEHGHLVDYYHHNGSGSQTTLRFNSDIPAGVYTLRATTNQAIYTQKLVLTR